MSPSRRCRDSTKRAKIESFIVGMTAPTRKLFCDDSERAAPSGMYLRRWAASKTFSRVSALTNSGLLKARDTVAVDTPASRATSRMPLCSGRRESVGLALIPVTPVASSVTVL